MGNFLSLKPAPKKTPIPCLAVWSLSQMFQTTPYLQQCVKMVVQAKPEYFFIMADQINNQHSWIYIHQQQNRLITKNCVQGIVYNEAYRRPNIAELANIAENLRNFTFFNFIQVSFHIAERANIVEIA